jgi:hypothetical protein
MRAPTPRAPFAAGDDDADAVRRHDRPRAALNLSHREVADHYGLVDVRA